MRVLFINGAQISTNNAQGTTVTAMNTTCKRERTTFMRNHPTSQRRKARRLSGRHMVLGEQPIGKGRQIGVQARAHRQIGDALLLLLLLL